MEKYTSKELLEQLQADTRDLIIITNELQQRDPDILLRQPGEGRWSVAQAIEHLNAYGRYYLPAIGEVLKGSRYPANPDFSPGWLGDYFTRTMLPRNGKVVNKMNTQKGYLPLADIDSYKVLREFLSQEELLLNQLTIAEGTDIGKLRVPISLTKYIRMKLGDTFRFLIAHHQRHFVQVENTLKELGDK